MLRAKGVTVILAENEMGDPTAMAVGKGPMPEGWQETSQFQERSKEGIVAAFIPSRGMSFLFVSLDVETSKAHRKSLRLVREKACEVSKQFGRRLEEVYFGEHGREHVAWYENGRRTVG